MSGFWIPAGSSTCREEGKREHYPGKRYLGEQKYSSPRREEEKRGNSAGDENISESRSILLLEEKNDSGEIVIGLMKISIFVTRGAIRFGALGSLIGSLRCENDILCSMSSD